METATSSSSVKCITIICISRVTRVTFNRERQSARIRLLWALLLTLVALKGHRRADYTNAGQSRWEVNREATGDAFLFR